MFYTISMVLRANGVTSQVRLCVFRISVQPAVNVNVEASLPSTFDRVLKALHNKD